MPRKRSILVIAIFLATTFFLFNFSASSTPILLPSRRTSSLVPANATLGFGTIIAVSHLRSPRRPGLVWAANLTDLEIVIPEQKEWTEGDLEEFDANEGSIISKGSALAWLGHLNALRWFLENTTHSTALIIEDDEDWDVTIRQTQVPLIAAAVRHLLANGSEEGGYWSPTTTWDLLYPGHCDDLIAPTTYLSEPHLLYRDDTTPQHTLLHPDTYNFLRSLDTPEVCTFAYAIHRSSALQILKTLSREPDGGTPAFDVALLSSCRDEGWKCWSVSPELFHHVEGQSEIFRADRNGVERVQGEAEEREGLDRGRGRGTWNSGCGARHTQLWVDEADEGGRRVVKGLVRGMLGTGECLVDGVEEERGWKGCEWEECGAQS
ncbi:Nn.00g083020.m01.CDS01 [Neocucurbitaria sp. VM-36]